MERKLWIPQQRAVDQFNAAVAEGENAICITIPTGGGKTAVAVELIKQAKAQSIPTVFYTHRRLLTSQTSNVFDAAGLSHGIRASGYDPAMLRDVQIASIHTENIRVYEQEKWEHHKAGMVIIDEAHNLTSEVPRKIIKHHLDDGAVVVGLTATPVGLAGIYNKLIIGGTNSELRACGAHLPCYVYAPDEPDMRHVKKNAVGEYSEGDVSKKIMVQSIFGRVYKNLLLTNPELRPTILFAPGVPESRAFAAELNARGITAAHIDASTTENERKDILAGSKDGRIKVLCNRFVLREGWDAPWIGHCIMATVFGALSNFLQAGGRLLRADPDNPAMTYVTLQDHGGSYWRFGSLNADREWMLGDTDISIAKAKKEKASQGDPEPIVCPKCSAVRMTGSKCWKCGHEHIKSVRMVVQVDGKLKRMLGNVHKPPKNAKQSTDDKAWTTCLYICANSKKRMTFNNARAMFFKRTGRWPPDGLKHMPQHPPEHPSWGLRVSLELPWMRKRKD